MNKQHLTPEEIFTGYLKSARIEFVEMVSQYTVSEHNGLRTKADSFLIAYDQAVQRLEQPQQTYEDAEEYISAIGLDPHVSSRKFHLYQDGHLRTISVLKLLTDFANQRESKRVKELKDVIQKAISIKDLWMPPADSFTESQRSEYLALLGMLSRFEKVLQPPKVNQ